jgi:hypothetical protein
MTRNALLAALQPRALTYEESSLRSIDTVVAGGFLRLAQQLREHHAKLKADPEYQVPEQVLKEQGWW